MTRLAHYGGPAIRRRRQMAAFVVVCLCVVNDPVMVCEPARNQSDEGRNQAVVWLEA